MLEDLDIPFKFAIFIRLFSLPDGPLSKDNPCLVFCEKLETDEEPSFDCIRAFVENNLPEGKKHLIKILDNNEMLEYFDFVPQKAKHAIDMTKRFNLGLMSYICVLRRY